MSDIEKLKDEYIDHMMNPRNYGKIEDFDAKGIGKNPLNNELVEMYLKTDGEIIKDIKFQAIGCMSTVVGGSIFTDMVRQESLKEAIDVAQDFLNKLQNAPASERACGEMVAKAFLAAVENLKNRREGKEEMEHTLNISQDCVTELKNETE